MDRYQMMDKIAATLTTDEHVTIAVTNARGRTLTQYYDVSYSGATYINQRWGKPGTLREEYFNRVVSPRNHWRKLVNRFRAENKSGYADWLKSVMAL